MTAMTIAQAILIVVVVFGWICLARWWFPRHSGGVFLKEAIAIIVAGVLAGFMSFSAFSSFMLGASTASFITLFAVRGRMEPKNRTATERLHNGDAGSEGERGGVPWRNMEPHFLKAEHHSDSRNGAEGVSSVDAKQSALKAEPPGSTPAERLAYLDQRQAEENTRIDAKLKMKAEREIGAQKRLQAAKEAAARYADEHPEQLGKEGRFRPEMMRAKDGKWYPPASGKTMALARVVVRSFTRKIADEEKRRLLALLLIELNEEEIAAQDDGAKDEEMYELLVSRRTLEVFERWREQVVDEMRSRSGEEMLQALSFVALLTETFFQEMTRRGLAPE